jgi:hypothetical protein
VPPYRGARTSGPTTPAAAPGRPRPREARGGPPSRCKGRLEVGEKVWYDGIHCSTFHVKGGWATVTAIRPGEVRLDGGSVQPDGAVVPPELVVETNLCKFSCSHDTPFRAAMSRLAKLDTLRAAVAYQATLTKSGKPRK